MKIYFKQNFLNRKYFKKDEKLQFLSTYVRKEKTPF